VAFTAVLKSARTAQAVFLVEGGRARAVVFQAAGKFKGNSACKKPCLDKTAAAMATRLMGTTPFSAGIV